MRYAISHVSGKQYILKSGETVTLDKIAQNAGDKYTFDKILLLHDDDRILVGTPYIQEAQVTGKIVKQYKGDKIHVYKFRAKIRYRRKMGYRSSLTDVLVEDIKLPKPATAKKPAKKKQA